jgi:hypothetical protein
MFTWSRVLGIRASRKNRLSPSFFGSPTKAMILSATGKSSDSRFPLITLPMPPPPSRSWRRRPGRPSGVVRNWGPHRRQGSATAVPQERQKWVGGTATAGAGAPVGCTVSVEFPMWMRSPPFSRSVPWIFRPLRKVPLRDPMSETAGPEDPSSMAQCERETWSSLSWKSDADPRPRTTRPPAGRSTVRFSSGPFTTTMRKEGAI